jgi:DNA-binding transcriptional LysR family regulator
MRLTQLRQADLNLLVVFAVLAEERNVSRAAQRLLLSQPAVSRALGRLRELFGDDLLVRAAGGYEPTPRGQRLLHELETMLPRLDRLLSGGGFDPAREEASFRIMATDNATMTLGPLLTRAVLPAAPQVTFEVVAWNEGGFDALERGRLDLLLNADDGSIPSRYATEVLFEEDLVCVVAAESRHRRRLTLRQYLDAAHVAVGIIDGKQTIVERQLRALGKQRRVVLRVPYFSVAVACVAGTALMATVPRRLAAYEARDRRLRIVEPPRELGGYQYLMAWHPRLESDAAHQWLRETMRTLGRRL